MDDDVTSDKLTAYKAEFGCGQAVERVYGNVSMSAPANVREAIKAIMTEHNYNPFVEMILIAKDPDTDRRTRATMAAELAQYIAPKLKGIDIDAKASGSIQVVVQRFAEEVMGSERTVDVSPEPQSLPNSEAS